MIARESDKHDWKVHKSYIVDVDKRWGYNVRLGIAYSPMGASGHPIRMAVSGRWEPSPPDWIGRPPDWRRDGQRFISTEGPHPDATRFSLRQQAAPDAPYLTISYFD